MPPPPETCPKCGADLPRRARACPDCGADERTGWSEDATVDRLELPGDPETFDHDAWVRSEFGDRAAGRRVIDPGRQRAIRRRRFWAWVAVVLLLAVAVGWIAF